MRIGVAIETGVFTDTEGADARTLEAGSLASQGGRRTPLPEFERAR